MNFPTLTHHASRRLNERFRGIDWRNEFMQAVPFGGQFRDSVLMLSPCGAVFVVEDYAIVTVLTKEQAMVNVQMHDPFSHVQPKSAAALAIPKCRGTEARQLNKAEQAQRVADAVAMGEQQAKRDYASGKRDSETMAERRAEQDAAEYGGLYRRICNRAYGRKKLNLIRGVNE